MSGQWLFNSGVILIFVGFTLVFFAVILMFFTTTKGKGNVKGGGAVIIGPFPIVFGTDKEAIKVILLLSIALIVIMLIVTVIFHFFLK